MWVQAHVKQFFEAVIGRLGAIEKAIQEHSSTTRNAQQEADVKWSEIPGIISSAINPEEEKRG
jgi:hypothetical protein